MSEDIQFRGVQTHNLKDIDVDLPRHRLIAVTGVSGCGKSSFAFDTVFREGERRYLSVLSSSARLLAGKLERAPVQSVRGLGPAVAIGQRGLTPNVRSTVGTVTGLWDLMRLLFSRVGSPTRTRAQLSFNDEAGQCPDCKGLGVVDEVDPDLLIHDATRSIRAGALVPTLKNGYTVYSQVTVDVMNDICQAHGFDVDTPWQELTEPQKQVIFHGSQKLRVPFGKHSLESRMKWSGITAKPREEGYYKGLIPVLEETLLRNRNDNVLRFVRSVPCASCDGSRLNAEARQVRIGELSLQELTGLAIRDLQPWLERLQPQAALHAATVTTVTEQTLAHITPLLGLGLGHLPLARSAKGLSSGELQRIRLAQQLDDDLAGLTYVLDEPSVDLHPATRKDLHVILHDLVAAGNTVLTVEHDPRMIAACDYVVDIGPGPGKRGGQRLFQGPVAELRGQKTATAEALERRAQTFRPTTDGPRLWLRGAKFRNLDGIDVPFRLGALNVVCGVSGAGKSTLVAEVLAPTLQRHTGQAHAARSAYAQLQGHESIDQVITLDQRPLGRTPRSNPATYTKLFDVIRKAFAAQPRARELGFKATRFSFNTAGGRCVQCEGAGIIRVGMHALGDVSVTCARCDGQRFDPQTLEVKLGGLDVAQVLDLEVREARAHLSTHKDAVRILDAMIAVGLDYLPIGQPATELSGGEAQRVRLAAELARPIKGHCLYVLDEPTKGLHEADLAPVLQAFERLSQAGHTLVVVEHNPGVWTAADWLIELGPGAGDEGGRLLFAGPPEQIRGTEGSRTAESLFDTLHETPEQRPAPKVPQLQLSNVRTHNLKGLDITVPKNALTVLTGPSGSGKTSLAFDTLAAEASHRLNARLGAHVRRLVRQLPRPELDGAQGITPTIALRQRTPALQPRSTVGTLTEVQDFLRLLFSRLGTPQGLPASALSFNQEVGACPSCTGLGFVLRADPLRLITHPDRPVLDGACAGTKIGRHFTDPNGQHAAVLRAAAERAQIDTTGPFEALSAAAQEFVLRGDGGASLSVTWQFKRGERAGKHEFESPWLGLLGLLDDEYARTHQGKGQALVPLMRRVTCEDCLGGRLNASALEVRVAGENLSQASLRPISTLKSWIEGLRQALPSTKQQAILHSLLAELMPRLDALLHLGLSHLHCHRGADTLSSGELMRVHLAAQIGAPMTGVTFVLDEPTRGLHTQDIEQLLQALATLTKAENSVLLVDHAPQAIAAADHLIVLGGPQGGELKYEGRPGDFMDEPPAPAVDLEPLPKLEAPPARALIARNLCANNLQGFDLEVPGSGITVIAGPSGSGKSTLLQGLLLAVSPEQFETLRTVHQAPLSGHWASVLATSLGIFEALRRRFAGSCEAKAAGLGKSAFGFTQAAGRCPACKGSGGISVQLDFLPDARATCEQCQGRRYRDEVLACQVQGRSIADVLDLSAQDALQEFQDDPSVARALRLLCALGLGHLSLGRAAPTLSGGEAQRVRLARELSKLGRGRTLFVLDEPSRGLDEDGVRRVQSILRMLATAGHAVIVVSHNLHLIEEADHVIELGPGGGPLGGQVVYEGSAQGLKGQPTATGRALISYERRRG